MKKYLNITVNEVRMPQNDASTAAVKLAELAEFVRSMHRNNSLLGCQTEVLMDLVTQIEDARIMCADQYRAWAQPEWYPGK